VKGGWGFVSFNTPTGLHDKVALAVRQARLASSEAIQLAPVAPVVDIVPPFIGKVNPLDVPLPRKKALLDEYNEIVWSTPGVTTSIMGYSDSQRRIAFATSEGAYIEQHKIDVSLRLSAMARADSDVQQAAISIGSNGDFTVVQGIQAQVKEVAERAVALLKAPYAKGGEHTVVLDPILAGVFTHEAFGHLSESDFLYEHEEMKKIMALGRKFGPPMLNIVDGAAVPGLRGSFKYDDEGAPSTKTYLIKEGYLVGRLHSRETAGKMRESATGNARALDFRFPPIVRMTNTYIEQGKVSFNDMISDIKLGVYARNWYGGMTSMEQFTFSAGEAYMIRNGKVAEMLRPVMLSGNVFATLEHVEAVGNDLHMNQGGGCGKGGQIPLPVSDGSPHIRIGNLLVGGK
ncbi:MAG: TldD/PmbA family protein, partial [Chloroflexota bacterium]